MQEEEIETMPREELHKLQPRRLRNNRHLQQIPLVQTSFSKAFGITADSVRSIEDIRENSLYRRRDMRASYPFQDLHGPAICTAGGVRIPLFQRNHGNASPWSSTPGTIWSPEPAL